MPKTIVLLLAAGAFSVGTASGGAQAAAEAAPPYPGNVFPLTGALIEERTVWAAEVRPDGQWRWFRHRLRAPAQRRMA